MLDVMLKHNLRFYASSIAAAGGHADFADAVQRMAESGTRNSGGRVRAFGGTGGVGLAVARKLALPG